MQTKSFIFITIHGSRNYNLNGVAVNGTSNPVRNSEYIDETSRTALDRTTIHR